MVLSIEKYLTGLFLLILTVSGGFVAETLGCSTRKLLSENQLVKQAILLFLIYFTINLTSGNDREDPINKIKSAIFVWIFFIIFTKMNIYFTGLVFFLLTVIYILNNYKKHYENVKESKESKELIKNLEKYIDKLEILMFLFLIIGFITYFLKQKKDQKQFNYLYFLFGRRKCRHLI